jgi:integrase
VTTARSRPALRLAVASGVDLAAAIDAFLSQPDLAPTTRAKYRQTLAVVEDGLGDAPVTGAGLAGVVAQRWHHASPATWNRHVATVRSFARYCERTRILDIDGDLELQRRAEKQDHTRSIPLASLERLWERRDIDLRERTLWRLLYETAARADEVLRLDVEDLDIPGKRARARSKGGDVDWLFFGSGSARLLPRLIAGRRTGPVFLSSLRPPRAPVLPPRRGAARRADRLDTAPVPSLRAHAPRRGQRAAPAPHGQESPPQPAHAAALRPSGPGRRSRAHGRARPGPPPLTSVVSLGLA